MEKGLDERFMSRCIELAARGSGQTSPNPMVGSVVVVDGQIIGEGWHHKAGQAHAEVNALQNLTPQKLKKATLYVNLEPCCHTGKTPPCTNLILDKKIQKVVVGCADPNKKVAGQGIAQLKAAGVEVKVGVLESDCRALNKKFITYHEKQRPHITLKWAQSLDGFLAPEKQNLGHPHWITSKVSRQLVHQWRAENQAILVGSQTVIQDNPRLTVRDWNGQNPLRIVIDKSAALSASFHVFNQEATTLVFGLKKNDNLPSSIQQVVLQEKNNINTQICQYLFNLNIQSLLVEGGKKTFDYFLKQNLWDSCCVFTGPGLLEAGLRAPHKPSMPSEITEIGGDVLEIFENPNAF